VKALFKGIALSFFVVLMLLIGVMIVLLFPAWIAMILIGILHGYHNEIPAIGFWQTLVWLWLIAIIGAAFRGISNTTKDTK
jgi:hypothetical protein